jgi:hypothetical protein
VSISPVQLGDINEPVDFVVLDAHLNGIVWNGNILKILARTRSFSKTYLINSTGHRKVKEYG